jgi:hypothetical protein
MRFVSGASLAGWSGDAQRFELADGGSDGVSVNAVLDEIFIRARQQPVLFRLETVFRELDFQPVKDAVR